MQRRIVFHIGLEKTGTTSFQQFCAEHRAELERGGFLFPRFRARLKGNHAGFAASYLAGGPRDNTIVAFAPKREAALRAVRREIAASPASAVLMSAEHFSSRFDRARALRLADDFRDLDPLIVVAVRDLHARFLSAYSTTIEAGGQPSLEDYAAEVLHPDNPYLDLAATLAPWREAFGDHRLRLVDYDAEPDMIAALLRACGIEGLDSVGATRYRLRAGMGPGSVEALRLCNAMLRERQGLPGDRLFPIWAQHILFSNACRREIQRNAPIDDGRPWTISKTALAGLDRVAEAERRWLAEQFGFMKRIANARERIVVAAGLEADDAAARSLATVVVRRMTRFAWPVSKALVTLALAGRR